MDLYRKGRQEHILRSRFAKPLSVDAEKSSDEAPPTPTCCKNKDSPQAILSVSADMLVTQPLEEL